MSNYFNNKMFSTLSLADKEYINDVITCDDTSINKFLSKSKELKITNIGNDIELCSIINAKSGLCSENCSFCAQSAHYDTGVNEYDFIDLSLIEKAAKKSAEQGVKRFSIVTSGKILDNNDFKLLLDAVSIVCKLGLLPDVSVGILTDEMLYELKKHGLAGVHHNLETSETFFPNICTTHDYIEDIRAVERAKSAGLYVCSGGIFGIGESWSDRVELALTLKILDVDSVPINFLNRIKGTPLENIDRLSLAEALKIVIVYRYLLPTKQIRICGGRNVIFNEKNKRLLLDAGASGLMVGNYLTTLGFLVESDLEDIADYLKQL